jgi:hypothetical protein
MLLTYKITLDNVYNKNVPYSIMTVLLTTKCLSRLHSLHPLTQENNYNELFISILAHLFPIN